ncbi:MAG: tetrahydromethanopterin S-methyltransferase subunit D [Methanosphaera sp.]|nr:tetrahydromethanopterin S-methyltransferase subunit D [Methanosphaera sp.]
MIELILSIIIGSTLIGIGVHFIPVGGAPAALSTTAGIPTGTPMITIGMGITGIISAISLLGQSTPIILLGGAIGSMTMIAITMLFSNMIHVYGVGVPPASSNFEKDPITGFSQSEYVSPGTTGHGIPTVSFISGIIGAFLGGLGGTLAFIGIYNQLEVVSILSQIEHCSIATIISIMIFFIIAVISSYNIGGTIQGFYDKKFRNKIVSGTVASFIVSIVLAIIFAVILGGI